MQNEDKIPKSTRCSDLNTPCGKPIVSNAQTAVPLERDDEGKVFTRLYVNEPDNVSFGVKEYAPGRFVLLHHHHTWELVIIDASSEGPGYIFFDGRWRVCDPGSVVFIPEEYPVAFSAGRRSFRMLFAYGGSLDQADRVLDEDEDKDRHITSDEEEQAMPMEIGGTGPKDCGVPSSFRSGSHDQAPRQDL